MHGFLNVLKPPGMTSSDVVVAIRRRLPKGTRVGHAGTLDPEAAGVLPIMIGNAARLFDYLVDKEKAYVAAIRFGIVTDTQDAQGTVLSRSAARPTCDELEAVLPRFTGVIHQRPSAFSAIKQDGKRLYELARAGLPVEVPSREITVHGIRVNRWISEDEALITVRCGKGTYIRALCHDIGQALGCGAHMSFLLRTRSGVFELDNAVTWETLRDTKDLLALLRPIDAPLAHLPRVDALPSALAACLNGNPLRHDQLAGPLPDTPEPVRIYAGEFFAGMGRREGERVRFDAMLLDRGNA